MQTFLDADGHKWTLELLRPEMERIRSETGVNLLRFEDPAQVERLLNDAGLIVDMVSILLTDEIRQRHASSGSAEPAERWFARKLKGDAIDRASEAFLRELIDFFPSRQGKPLAEALRKTRELMTLRTARLTEMISGDRLDRIVNQSLDDFDRRLDHLAHAAGKSSTGSAACAAPIPTAAPGDSSTG